MSRTPEPPAPFDLGEVQKLSVVEMRAAAAAAGLELGGTSRDLCFALARARLGDATTLRVSGLLDVRPDGYGFLRSPHHEFRAGADDVYLSANQVHRLGLRTGHHVTGAARPPKGDEDYFAMMRVETVEGREPPVRVVDFGDHPAVFPYTPLDPGSPLLRRLAPIARGHRVLIRTAPGTRRIAKDTLRALAICGRQVDRAATEVLWLAIDQDPAEAHEDAAALAHRALRFTTLYGDAPQRSVEAMTLAMARARRAAEIGRHVIFCVDSLTALVRACNEAFPHTGKVLVPGLDSHALRHPRQVFATARQLEHGGSVTVLAVIESDARSEIDCAIEAEFARREDAYIVFREDGRIDEDATRTRPESRVETT